MLKIKDNVDLKELEKYGFEYHRMVYTKEIIRTGEDILERKTIYVSEYDREISIKNGLFNIDEELNTIYDLIKADLVEKVGSDE